MKTYKHVDTFYQCKIYHKKLKLIDFKLKEKANFIEFLKNIKIINYKLNNCKFNQWFLIGLYNTKTKTIRNYLRNL